MPKLYGSIILLFLMLPAASQLPVLHWVKGFEENNIPNYSVYNNGRTVGVDAQGNVYSAGLFEYAVDFDPGPGVYSMAGGSPHNYGIYISKLNANGDFVWARQVPTLVEFGQIELKVDGAGNVYLASDLRNPADMDPGPGVFMMSPTGFRDAFVVKLNTNGDFIWAKQFGGPGDTGPQSTSIEIDKDNNVIIAGLFNNTVDFDPGPGTLNLTSTAHFQAFVVKLNNAGDLVWVKQFGNSPIVHSGSTINDMKSDAQGNIVLIGRFTGSSDFDPGNGVYNVTGSSGSIGDGFICKLDANSNFVWVKAIGQTGGYNHFLTPTGVDIDGMNNIVTSGFFIGNFDFDPGPGVQEVSNNPHECYILKLDQHGNFVWVKTIGMATGSDTGNDVVVDEDNNVYAVGSFGTSVDYDPGPGVFLINNPYYGAETLIKLTSAGNFVYAAPFQSISYGSGLFRRMAIDANRNIYVTGSVGGIVDFEPGANVYPFESGGGPFVVKLGRCLSMTTSTLNINACNSFTLNNETFDVSGTYKQTIPNSTGCDSIITLHLTINKKLTEQTKSICNGEIFFAGGSNQYTAGIYYDTLQTVLGCDSIVTTRLIVNPKPSPELGIDKSLCKNTQLTLTPGSFTDYLWQDNSTHPMLTVDRAGVYWVTVTNSFNCQATDTFKVATLMEPPSNFLKETDSLCSYKSLELIPSDSYSNYQWSTGAVNKILDVQMPGTYWLTVTDTNGCTGKDSITIFSKKCMYGVYIPTAFTPDNNGNNDIFKPLVFGNPLQYRFVVYNRWGNVVFQTTDPTKGWDGRIAGTLQDNAVFVWICNYHLEGDKPRTEKGTVLLIR